MKKSKQKPKSKEQKKYEMFFAVGVSFVGVSIVFITNVNKAIGLAFLALGISYMAIGIKHKKKLEKQEGKKKK